MSKTTNSLLNVGAWLAPARPQVSAQSHSLAQSLTPRALVLRAPGINCDRETARACQLAGFETDLLHINQLIKTPERLLDYQFLVIPGGFSYGDDLGAGTLLAKNLVIHLGKQLHHFIDEGRLVLGICNGFQVLVRAGLLPGEESTSLDASHLSVTSLTSNASTQFECRWVTLSTQPGPCIFTRGIHHPIELPVAHGEGQFVLADSTLLSVLQENGQIPCIYTPNFGNLSPPSATTSFSSPTPYPDNPNGSIGNVAGVCNARGNVFGLMPHPERCIHALQHPQRRGSQGYGDGLLIFKNAYEYARGKREAREGGWGQGGGGWGQAPPLLYSGDEREAEYSRGDPRGRSVSRSPVQWGVEAKYTSSGVDIDAAETTKELMREAVRATQGPEVLAGMGAFAGVYDLSRIQHIQQPALVASTDGVGTKTLIAAQAGRFDTIGYDLVNHSVNDLLTQRATPLFFMDYLAMGKLDPIHAATIVKSVAMACQEVGCALLGGETAEMPDVYLPGAFDLAGTIVGIVERDAVVGSRQNISVGDILLGLPSNGLHTNGYSLARHIFASFALDTFFPELQESLIDALLRPHRCYLREVQILHTYPGMTLKGIAHITGGGFEANIVRILPPGIQVVVKTGAWKVPPIFDLIEHLGDVPLKEMYHTFNMGVGMVFIVSPEAAEQAQRLLPELLKIGYITEGEGVILQ